MTNAREVVSRCLQNEAAAQKQLYDHYAPMMLAICYRYTKDRHEASDVLQEGFVRVFRNLHQWKQEGELGAWVRRIMVNTALNWLRDHRRMQFIDDNNISDDHDAASVLTPIQEMEAKQLADLIRQLPSGYQAVFNLHAIEGYSHVEIAKMLNISEGTCRSQYLRARKQLVERIGQSQLEKNQVYAGKQ
jgi:RNA polymerase sigma-70 factor (ECF subfamily)